MVVLLFWWGSLQPMKDNRRLESKLIFSSSRLDYIVVIYTFVASESSLCF
jgi:hypothetical protein